MGSQQTESDARRRANALTAPQNSPLPPCPMMAPLLLLWPSCQMNLVWSTLPLTPAWRIIVSQAARLAWLLGVAQRRVSVSGRIDVCVCSCSMPYDVIWQEKELKRCLFAIVTDWKPTEYRDLQWQLHGLQSKPSTKDLYSYIYLHPQMTWHITPVSPIYKISLWKKAEKHIETKSPRCRHIMQSRRNGRRGRLNIACASVC